MLEVRNGKDIAEGEKKGRRLTLNNCLTSNSHPPNLSTNSSLVKLFIHPGAANLLAFVAAPETIVRIFDVEYYQLRELTNTPQTIPISTFKRTRPTLVRKNDHERYITIVIRWEGDDVGCGTCVLLCVSWYVRRWDGPGVVWMCVREEWKG